MLQGPASSCYSRGPSCLAKPPAVYQDRPDSTGHNLHNCTGPTLKKACTWLNAVLKFLIIWGDLACGGGGKGVWTERS